MYVWSLKMFRLLFIRGRLKSILKNNDYTLAAETLDNNCDMWSDYYSEIADECNIKGDSDKKA